MTLQEYKNSIRRDIRSLKETLKEYKCESAGLNKAGYYITSSKYEARCSLEIQLESKQSLLKDLNKIRSLK